MKKVTANLLIVIILLAFFGCSQQSETSENSETWKWEITSQLIEIETPGGKFNVWTQRNGNSPSMRLLLLHGGPGATHEYFKSLEEYFPNEQIEFIYYDQLGSGKSDNPNDTSYWNIPRFVDEVEQVRQTLNLDNSNFYLLGSSWGGILAMEYALKHQEHLKGLIISNMMASCIEYGKYAEEVLAPQFDPEILAKVRALEAAGDFENPEYMEILMTHYYPKHVLRLPIEEWPDAVNSSFADLNHGLYVHMQGPSEFGIGGTLATWDRSADLFKIKVPTLVIGAQHDTMDPKYMEWMATQFPNGTYLHCPNGSHLAMWDDKEIYHTGLIAFIKKINEGS
jgi:proline iminopeptidase